MFDAWSQASTRGTLHHGGLLKDIWHVEETIMGSAMATHSGVGRFTAWTLLGPLGMIGLLSLMSCGSPPPDPPRPVSMAGADEEIVAAIEAAVARVHADPASMEAWRALALTYQSNGHPALAATCWNQVVRTTPASTQSFRLLALSLDAMGDGPGRLKAITEAVQRGPGNADGHWLKSNFHRADGDIDPAIEHARSAVAIDADSVPATHALVLSLLESGQDSLAESAVRAWLKQHPGDLYGHHLLGTTLRNQGRQLAAAPHLAAGSGSGPDWIHGDQPLIEAMGRGLQARRKAAIRKMEQGEAAAAAEELTLLSEANPEDASLLINLAMAQLAMDQRAAARNSLKRALQLNAELDLAHRQLAAVELRGHSADTLRAQPDLLLEAERNLRRARGIAPNSSANQALLGRVLVLQGRPEEAADLLLLAGLANPGDTGLTLKTVGLLLELKRYDDMIELLKILRVLRPGDPQVVLLMAKAQYGRGELETAVAQLKQAARRWPRHGAIRSTLAQWNATP